MKNILSTFIDFIFPKRKQEINLQNIDISEIIKLPKANFFDKNINPIFSYKNQTVKDIIWELKYHRNKNVLEKIGIILSDFIKEDLSEKFIFNKNQNYILVPIPISKQSLLERGFCQTELLCEEIIKNLKNTEFEAMILYRPNTLKKIKETKKQSHSKNKEARLINLKDCFRADCSLIKDKNIILIDDVITTGATINEAMETLTESRAKEVVAYTIAH